MIPAGTFRHSPFTLAHHSPSRSSASTREQSETSQHKATPPGTLRLLNHWPRMGSFRSEGSAASDGAVRRHRHRAKHLPTEPPEVAVVIEVRIDKGPLAHVERQLRSKG